MAQAESYYDMIRDLEDERDHLDNAPDWPPYDVCSQCGPLTYEQSQQDHGECGFNGNYDEPEYAPARYETQGPRRGLRVDGRDRDAEQAAGFRLLMRAALAGAPEAYRYDNAGDDGLPF